MRSHLIITILKETSNAKLYCLYPSFVSTLCVIRYEPCQHVHHCLVFCHELFVVHAKLGFIFCKTE